MGAWTDLTISDETIKGYLPRTLHNRSLGDADTSAVNTNTLSRAKRDVVNSITRKMGEQVEKMDSPGTFMDVLAAFTPTADYVQDVLAAAWAHRYFREEGIGQEEQAAMAKQDFYEALDALIAYAKKSDDLDDALDDAIPSTSDATDVRLGNPVYSI